MPAIEQALPCTRVRVSVKASPGQTYAIHSEVLLNENEREFVIVKCHFNSRQPAAQSWVVELKNEPGDVDRPWYIQYFEGDVLEMDTLTGIGDVFTQPTAHYMLGDEVQVRAPLLLRNEYELGPTWTDFYRGSRKVARVYTLYYRGGKDVRGNELQELLWVHAQEDYAGPGAALEDGAEAIAAAS